MGEVVAQTGGKGRGGRGEKGVGARRERIGPERDPGDGRVRGA